MFFILRSFTKGARKCFDFDCDFGFLWLRTYLICGTYWTMRSLVGNHQGSHHLSGAPLLFYAISLWFLQFVAFFFPLWTVLSAFDFKVSIAGLSLLTLALWSCLRYGFQAIHRLCNFIWVFSITWFNCFWRSWWLIQFHCYQNLFPLFWRCKHVTSIK